MKTTALVIICAVSAILFFKFALDEKREGQKCGVAMMLVLSAVAVADIILCFCGFAA